MLLEEGQHVMIVSTHNTDVSFGLNSSMRELYRNKKPVRIGACSDTSARIGPYMWNIKDLKPYKPKKIKPNVFHCDVEKLNF